ncbi:lipocalin family protein (plasmid) [Paraburkholderia strydomiana]
MACLVAFMSFLSGCAYGPAPERGAQALVSACTPGAPIDLQRYMGRWYVLADTPFLSEHDFVGNYDEWTLRADGTIDDQYLGRRHDFNQQVSGSHFVAKVMGGTGNTRWRVALIWPFEVVVVTAYVDPEYRYTIRCMEDGNMVWVLARAPEIDEATYKEMLGRLRAMGYNPDRMRRVPQKVEEIGKPGFR